MEFLTFDIFCVMIFGSVFCLLLVFGEWLFDKAYQHIPFFRRWWDNECESMAEFDKEDEVM